MGTTATKWADPAVHHGRAIGPAGARIAGEPDIASAGRAPGANPAGEHRFLLAALGLLAASATHAQFQPAVTVGVTHTDNIALQPEDEQSEIVYRVEPAFRYTKETRAVTINAAYLLQAFRYQDLDDDQVFHQYRANVRAALLPDTLFLEVGGNREQAIVDPEQTIPFSNLPISGNRQDRDEYYIAPSLQHVFGGDVAVAADYRQSWIEFEQDQVQSGRQATGRFSLDNYRRERGLSWALRYDWDRSEYDLDEPWEYQKAMAELGFWAGAHTRFFAAAGKESAWDNPLDPSLEDDLWEAGLAQQVGERLSAEFAVGERSFGNSWRGNLRLRFLHGSTSLSYSETPTTEGRIRVSRGVFDGLDVPESVLVRPGSSERFIAENLTWTLSVKLRRTTLGLSFFDSNRVERTEADGTPLPDESERGASCSLSYEVGARTDLRLGAWWAEREFDTGNSELVQSYFEINYQLGGRTDLALNYTYAEENPDGLADAREYVANTISLDLTRKFY